MVEWLFDWLVGRSADCFMVRFASLLVSLIDWLPGWLPNIIRSLNRRTAFFVVAGMRKNDQSSNELFPLFSRLNFLTSTCWTMKNKKRDVSKIRITVPVEFPPRRETSPSLHNFEMLLLDFLHRLRILPPAVPAFFDDVRGRSFDDSVARVFPDSLARRWVQQTYCASWKQHE